MPYLLSRFLKLIVIIFVLCGLLIALLPTLASTEWGRKQVMSWINRSIPGKIEIERLDLHWGKGQNIEGFLLKDPEGLSILEIEKFSTEATLWQLLHKSTHLGFTRIQELNAAIVTDRQGGTNLQNALGIQSSQDMQPLSPSTIVLSNTNAEFYLFAQNHPLSASINGITRQGSLNGSFDINLVLNDLQVKTWENLKETAQNYLTIEGSKNAKLEARIINFPVDLIDRLAALQHSHLNGLFRSILGDRLNLMIDKEPSQEGLAFNLTTSAPLMEGEIKGKVVHDILTLQEPAQFNFYLIPESINRYTQYRFELSKPSQLQINIPTLSIPLNVLDSNSSIDPCLFAFESEIVLPETQIDTYSVGPLSILGFHATVQTPACDKNIYIKSEGKAQQGKEPFTFNLETVLQKPQSYSQLLGQLCQNMQASLKISHLPFQLIPFLQDYPDLKEHVGTDLSTQLIITPKGKEDWEAQLSFQTSRLEVKEAKFRLGKDLTLISPVKCVWKAPVDFFQKLFHQENWILDEPFSLEFVLKSLQIPLDHPKFTKYQMESSVPLLQLSQLLSWAKVRVQDVFLKVSGQNIEQFNTQLKGKLALLSPDGTLSPLLKEPLKFTQSSFWKMSSDKKIEMPSGKIEIHNSIAHIQIAGHLDSDHQFELIQPSEIQYSIDPSAFKSLSELLGKAWPRLQKPTQFTLTMDPAKIDLNSFDFSALKMQGNLAIDHVYLYDHSGTYSALDDLNLSWVLNAPMNNFYANVNGSVYSYKGSKASPLSAYIQFWPEYGQYTLNHTQTEFRLNCTGFPTSLVNVILNTDDLSPILGPIIDLNIKTFFDPTNQKPGYWDILLDSSNFHLNGRFKLEEGVTIFDLDKLPTVHLTITPESYTYIKKMMVFQNDQKLAIPFTIACNLADLYFPLMETGTDPFKIDLEFSSTNVEWNDSANNPIKLEGQVNTKSSPELVHFSIKALSNSSLTLQGTIRNLLDERGHLQPWQNINIGATAHGLNLSPLFVQNLFFLTNKQTEQVRALVGDSFELNAKCQIQNLNGPVQASLIGTQGKMTIDGKLKQGVLTLNVPLEASFTMSPLFNQVFLTDLPFWSSALDAENPIQLKIDPSLFSCPLFPFNPETVKIGKGTLDLGKIRFKNEGEWNTILQIIRPSTDPFLNIWFTPLYFELAKGELELHRFDLLVANTYTLASWGKCDLNTQQSSLVLGLTAQTLQYAFGIRGLDEKTMLQIPLQGKNQKIEIDKKKVAGKVAALLTQSQSGNKFLGNILDFAFSKDTNEMTPPVPTTQPFPWEGKFLTPSTETQELNPTNSDQSKETDEKESIEKKKKQKHPKKLKTEAIQIFEHLFGQPSSTESS